MTKGAKCRVCAGPATCLGAYEENDPAYSCDEHCGHGCEDGQCCPLADVPGLIAKLNEWNDRYSEERDAARASDAESLGLYRSARNRADALQAEIKQLQTSYEKLAALYTECELMLRDALPTKLHAPHFKDVVVIACQQLAELAEVRELLNRINTAVKS